jgi:hypothetical protein
MNREQLLQRIEKAWAALEASYAGLADADLLEAGVVGEWSVKDILGHVTTWEEEALKYLPVILQGGTPPRYAVQYGGIDAFNARMVEDKRGLSLAEVLRQSEGVHRRLLDYVRGAPEGQISRETPFRHRLRLDTYSHYPIHSQAIWTWRQQAAK